MRPDLADPGGSARPTRAELREPGARLAPRRLPADPRPASPANSICARRGSAARGLRAASWTAIAAGWAIFIAVIVYRTRCHKARMAED